METTALSHHMTICYRATGVIRFDISITITITTRNDGILEFREPSVEIRCRVFPRNDATDLAVLVPFSAFTVSVRLASPVRRQIPAGEDLQTRLVASSLSFDY